MYDSNLRQVVSEFSEKVLTRTISEHWYFHASSTELLVEVDVDGTTCSYYFVDHENTVIFWLDEVSTEELDIPIVSGFDHLRGLFKLRISVQNMTAYPSHSPKVPTSMESIGYIKNTSLLTERYQSNMKMSLLPH